MPKIEKILDLDEVSGVMPLRVTRRKTRKLADNSVVGASIRVKCGCCEESLVIHHDDPETIEARFRSLEINGVNGSVAQWRKILLPLLELSPTSKS